MSLPLVSIIIPTYNSVQYLNETLESALNQSHENIEVILIDDGSTDGTKEHFSGFKKKGIICLHQENMGANIARNKGLDIAKGDYIQFLDADDILHPKKIEAQLELLEKQNTDLSFTLWNRFTNNTNENNLFPFQHADYNKNQTGVELMISFGSYNWYIPTVAWLVRRSLIEKAGYWNPVLQMNQDGEYFSRLLISVKNVICIDEILSYYRDVDKESTSKLTSEKKLWSLFESWQIIHALVAKVPNTKLLAYPKNAYHDIYLRSLKPYPQIAKLIANEFDKIDENCHLSKQKKLWWFVNRFGLHRGLNLHKQYTSTTKRPKKFIKEVLGYNNA